MPLADMSMVMETSRPLRETSLVSPNSIFWPKGVVHNTCAPEDACARGGARGYPQA